MVMNCWSSTLRALSSRLAIAALVLPMAVCSAARAADTTELEMVQSITTPDLEGVVNVAISKSGDYVYAASSAKRAISVFKRDPETGQLTPIAPARGFGPFRVRVSSDDQYVEIADPNGGVVAIYQREAATGALKLAAKIVNSPDVPGGLTLVNDAHLSPDDHFLYTASINGLGVFKFENNELTFVQFEPGEGNLAGLRRFALSPDGHWLYAPACIAGALSVFRRDEATGKLDPFQTIHDGDDGITSISGAHRLSVSSDGRQVYVSSGRFGGVQAISAFEVQGDGKLKLLQEFINGKDDFSEFEGGNEVQASPDGKWVFAVASLSDRLFRFSRDPATGKLTFIDSQQAGNFAAPGAASVCASYDGKFVYVADDKEGAIEVFKLP